MTYNKSFWDDLNKTLDFTEDDVKKNDIETRNEKLDILIHDVFSKSDPGRELLSMWKESLIMQAGAIGGMDMLSVGIIEGQKRFIRGIILTIKRVERGSNG